MNCAAILKSLNDIEQIILDSYNDDKPVPVDEASQAIEAIRSIEKELTKEATDVE